MPKVGSNHITNMGCGLCDPWHTNLENCGFLLEKFLGFCSKNHFKFWEVNAADVANVARCSWLLAVAWCVFVCRTQSLLSSVMMTLTMMLWSVHLGMSLVVQMLAVKVVRLSPDVSSLVVSLMCCNLPHCSSLFIFQPHCCSKYHV